MSADMGNRRQRLDSTLINHRRTKRKRKLSSDASAQKDLEIKKRLLQQLNTSDNEFVQIMGRLSSKMDRLNSNIEMLVQQIMRSGNRGYMPPPSPHTPLTKTSIPMRINPQDHLGSTIHLHIASTAPHLHCMVTTHIRSLNY